jgi:hypothetical protein
MEKVEVLLKQQADTYQLRKWYDNPSTYHQ